MCSSHFRIWENSIDIYYGSLCRIESYFWNLPQVFYTFESSNELLKKGMLENEPLPQRVHHFTIEIFMRQHWRGHFVTTLIRTVTCEPQFFIWLFIGSCFCFVISLTHIKRFPRERFFSKSYFIFSLKIKIVKEEKIATL